MKSKVVSIVIDADIAKAAGGSEHPTSSSSRNLLIRIENEGHTMVMCPKLREEWNKHQSIYTSIWRSKMISRRKLEYITHSGQVALHIDGLNIAEATKERAVKDAHLLDAALISDKIVASNDFKARDAYRGICKLYGVIRPIAWIGAVLHKDFVDDKSKSFSKIPKKYLLGYKD